MAAKNTAQLRIGISGWTYPPWRKVFFPEGLPHREELGYASRQVNSIEINGTFYSLQRPSSFGAWFDRTPEDFVFSVKAPRFITHIKRLRESETPLANFWASGVLRLNQKLGPILWQLPPSLTFDAGRLGTFLAALPRETAEAARAGRRHDSHLGTPAWTRIDENRPLRHALEVRHESFRTPEFIGLLREHQVALVVADTAGKWPLMEDATANFIYLRLHGDEELYVSGYTPQALDGWAKKIAAWRKGVIPAGARLTAPPAGSRTRARDIFAYFDNDVKTRAPYDAMALAHRLGTSPKPGAAPAIATIPEEARRSWPSWRPQGGRRAARTPARVPVQLGRGINQKTKERS